MMEMRKCGHCGCVWTVELETVLGDSVPSDDELGIRRQKWTIERVIEGTPCDCARRAEEEAARLADRQYAEAQQSAIALYIVVTSAGRPLGADTPLRTPDYDSGGWREPTELGPIARRFWVMHGRLFFVGDGTAREITRGAKYVDGELRVSDPQLLM